MTGAYPGSIDRHLRQISDSPSQEILAVMAEDEDALNPRQRRRAAG